MKGFAIHNAPTDHGGRVPATQMRSSQMGNLFVCAGDGHLCPKCKGWSTIIKSHDHVLFDGKAVAYVGDSLTCGAKILPQQSHVVGESGGGSGSSSLSSFQPVSSQQNQATTNSLVADDTDKTCFCNKKITIDLLQQILPKEALTKGLFYRSQYPKMKGLDLNTFLDLLNTAMDKHQINTCLRKAHFLAQISCEGDHFRTTEEYKNRDGSIPANWNNYEGGAQYHGRGIIQLTHSSNYEKYGAVAGQKFVPNNLNLVASEPLYVIDSATWYWEKGSIWGNANTYADKDDVHYITMLINGGFNDYCGRKANLLKLIPLMKIKENCVKVKESKQAIGVYSFGTSKLNSSKVATKIWKNYHINKLKSSNVSCEPL